MNQIRELSDLELDLSDVGKQMYVAHKGVFECVNPVNSISSPRVNRGYVAVVNKEPYLIYRDEGPETLTPGIHQLCTISKSLPRVRLGKDEVIMYDSNHLLWQNCGPGFEKYDEFNKQLREHGL